MNFWLKHIIIGTILVILAMVLFKNHEWIFEKLELSEIELSLDDMMESEPEEPSEPEFTDAEVAKAKPVKSKSNKAAEGLSSFYASINPDYGEKKGPRIHNNIVYLEQPELDVDQYLEELSVNINSISEHWQGEKSPRPFRQGETLYQKLLQYSNEAGVELVWQLDKDFIIKSGFRINKTITQTAHQISKSISGHYPMGVSAFFCYNQRVIVIIEDPSSYLYENCKELKSKREQEW